MEEIILEFWECSIKSDFSNFDWEDAFEEYACILKRFCVLHGQGTYEEYRDEIEGYHCVSSLAEGIPGELLVETDWWCFTAEDALEAIFRAQYECLKECFTGTIHSENWELLQRVYNRGGLTEPELIQLFDECIHAEHVTGDILEDIDIDELREQAEEEYKEQQKFPTNIREFLQ